MKIIKRIVYCFLACAIVLNFILNSITCINVEPACDYINSHALEKSHGRRCLACIVNNMEASYGACCYLEWQAMGA